MSAVVAFILFVSSLTGFAQTDTSLKHPATDQQKLADALRAGPSFVTKDASFLTGLLVRRIRMLNTESFVQAKATGPSPRSPWVFA